MEIIEGKDTITKILSYWMCAVVEWVTEDQ
jgi:hypothetical protein